MTNELCITVNGTEVWLQGLGDEVVLMLHGWPDTRALWDGTVAALQDRATCARLTLPGFESGPAATSLDDMCQLLRQIVDRISPDRPVTLMLHDWGCFFGYQFYMRHPELVASIIGVDIGDSMFDEEGAKLVADIMDQGVVLAGGARFLRLTGQRQHRRSGTSGGQGLRVVDDHRRLDFRVRQQRRLDHR